MFKGLSFILAVALAVVARGADRLDPMLDAAAGWQPVFVRLDDQLLKATPDFDAFCKAHETRPRSEVRKEVLTTLRSKADDSWKRVEQKVADLQSSGDLRDVTRFWIVNGFACEATGKGCQELAELASVAYVYKQTAPTKQQESSRPQAPRTLDDLTPEQRSKALQRLKAEEIDPKEVRVNVRPNVADAEAPALVLERMKPLADSSPEEGAFKPDGLQIGWDLKMVQADLAWQEGATGKGVVIALNDGGIVDIPALRPALWHNSNEQLDGKDNDGDGYVDDVVGYDFERRSGLVLDAGKLNHGTICAGVMAGRPVPGQATATGQATVTGMAPRAKLMILNGMGYLRVYEYALTHGADILSMSYMWVNMDLGQFRGVFRLAAEHLTAGGVFCVGGAGNYATSAPAGKQITLPKDIPCVTAVGGVFENGGRAPFSSRGPCTWDGVRFYDDYPPTAPLRKPDLAAPAGGFPCWTGTGGMQKSWNPIWTGDHNDLLVSGPQGNSFAGPHVAGAAALVFSVNPELNAWRVKQILQQTSKDIGSQGPDFDFGHGLLQAEAAVRLAQTEFK